VSPRGAAAERVQDGRRGQAAQVARAKEKEMVILPWPAWSWVGCHVTLA